MIYLMIGLDLIVLSLVATCLYLSHKREWSKLRATALLLLALSVLLAIVSAISLLAYAQS